MGNSIYGTSCRAFGNRALPIIPHLPKYCGDFSHWCTWPTISYPAATQEPVGISSSEACFDFEKQNNDEHNIEQLIYSENQQYVPDTSKPHITLIVAASLTGTDSSSIAVGEVVYKEPNRAKGL